MKNGLVAGLGLIFLVVLIAAAVLMNRQQTSTPLVAAPPTTTTITPLPPPPTYLATPTLAATKTATAVSIPLTTESVTITLTITVTAAATPLPTLPTPPQPTPTPPADTVQTQASLKKSVTFAVIGDYGWTGQGTFDVAALVHGWQPDLIITVGDNNYPDGSTFTIHDNITQHYGTFIEQNRFYPALGNHDVYTDLGQPYFDFFDLPGNERYYDFVWGDAHFFAVNSDWQEPDGITATSHQAQWLQAKLAASDEVWQIVYFHAPPFVSNADKIVPVMNWPFAAWGADIVFSGHAHVYERLTIDGIPYIVNGLGGHSIYNFDDTPHPASEVQYNGDFGAVLVELTASELTLRFVNRAGSTIDYYALVRP